jgi:hypothetical protein
LPLGGDHDLAAQARDHVHVVFDNAKV